jgi:hypothetical protein
VENKDKEASLSLYKGFKNQILCDFPWFLSSCVLLHSLRLSGGPGN